MNNIYSVSNMTVPTTQKTDNTVCLECHGADFQRVLDEFMNTDELESVSAKGAGKMSGTLLDKELVLPSMENVEELSSRLQYLLDVVYARNDIPSDPPVELDYSYQKNEVIVKGDRTIRTR